MEHVKVNFNMATIGKEVEAYVRSRAIKLGSFVVYEEGGQIVQEDPRTGQKTIIRTTQKQ